MTQSAAPIQRKMNAKKSIPFVLVHLVALVGVFMVPFAWKWVGFAVALYYLRMFGVTAGFHRYFSHRTFKTSRIVQFMLAFLAQSSVQKGALWWAANHRHHHKFSDLPEDLHSPIQSGFVWSHIGWILTTENDPTRWELIKDFGKYPELVWLNKYHHVPTVVFAVATYLLGGMPGLIWGFFVSTVLLWHGTFTINSLSHVYGTQRYETGDTSRNNFWLALLTMGEGWHNNHHTYMSSTNQGFFWWEIDMSYYLLKALSKVGLVWDLRLPPLELLEAKRVQINHKVVTELETEAEEEALESLA